MYDWRQIADMQYRISLAQAHAPKDFLTKTALLSVKVTTSALIILTPVQLVTTGLGGCIIAITFGLFTFLLTLIWLPFFALLVGTSWLWLHAWYSRPILLIPGILLAFIANLYVMLAPEPEKDAKYAKLSIAGEWPLSWYLIKPPQEYHKEPIEFESEEISET